MKVIASFFTVLLVFLLVASSCRQKDKPSAGIQTKAVIAKKKAICCESNIPSRFALHPMQVDLQSPATKEHEGMVYIKAGTFQMGGDNSQAAEDEYPKHKVTVDGFWMDATEVTNAQFKKFVQVTRYITTAERKPDWEELKKQLPPGTPKPGASVLVPASLVFKSPKGPVSLDDHGQW